MGDKLQKFENARVQRFDELLEQTQIPRMAPVAYAFERGSIHRDDIPGLIRASLAEQGLDAWRGLGARVALAVGSREIKDIDIIAKTVLDWLKEHGAAPFIFPAMGSHGGATAQGQRDILTGFGITEETMGVPIYASMEVEKIGETPDGLDVCIDRYANAADAIVIMGRIKPHTNFHGPVESGLLKMLTVGCGKQVGADICHSHGFDNMSKNVAAIAHEILTRKNVLFGIGIVEDGLHNTYSIQAIPPARIEAEEPLLLMKAKELVKGIPFEKVDVLVLDEIGKDISGSGMDMNVTGRSNTVGITRPFLERIVVLDLSAGSHNNCCGIGAADVTTKRFFDKTDIVLSYPNALIAHDPDNMKLPMVMPNDRNAIQTGIHTCMGLNRSAGAKLVWMHNTLSLDKFLISEALVEEAKRNPSLTVMGAPFNVAFDPNGNVPWL